MSNQSRKHRGYRTQVLVAEHLAANGWPYATDAGPSRPGQDVLGVPGLSIEVKARRDLDPLAWLRQAAKHTGLPFVVFRPDGAGETTVPDWPCLIRLKDLVPLLHAAGYGDRVDMTDV